MVLRAWRCKDGALPLLAFLESPRAKEARIAGAQHAASMGTLAKQMRVACHADKAMFLESLADGITKAPSGADYKSVHSLLRHKRKKPFTVEVLPTLLKNDNSVCRDSDEIRLRWRVHFSDLEAGTSVSPEGHFANTPKIWNTPDDIASLANFVDLMQALKSSPLGKAVGGDSIPHGLGVAAPYPAQNLAPKVSTAFRGCVSLHAASRQEGAIHGICPTHTHTHTQCARSFAQRLLLACLAL